MLTGLELTGGVLRRFMEAPGHWEHDLRFERWPWCIPKPQAGKTTELCFSRWMSSGPLGPSWTGIPDSKKKKKKTFKPQTCLGTHRKSLRAAGCRACQNTYLCISACVYLLLSSHGEHLGLNAVQWLSCQHWEKRNFFVVILFNSS